MSSHPRPDYGVDGYPFVVGLNAAFLTLALVAVVAAAVGHGRVAIGVGVLAALPAVPGLLGLHYVLRGKLLHRDDVLDPIVWRGDERVLDVGTGGGLLLVGAARRAPSGRAVGVDVWRPGDLSGNTRERTLRNAALEGVADRVEVRDEDARSLSFKDASFDVVVSMLCLHNIEERRDQALREIARVLRPGGTAVLSDLAGTGEYARLLAAQGLAVEHGPVAWGTFPFQRVVVGKRPT